MAERKRQERYDALVRDRKACRECAACTTPLANPAHPDLEKFDSPHLGPWSRWQHDLNARVLVVGQDWSGDKNFRDQCGLDRWSPTNRMLQTLLSSLDPSLDPGPPPGEPGFKDRSDSGLFFTNAVLCIKEGADTARVSDGCFTNCRSFLQRIIDLIQPRAIIAVGAKAYGSVRRVHNLSSRPLIAQLVNPAETMTPDRHLIPVLHLSPNLKRFGISRSPAQQQLDWARAKPHV